MKAKETIFKRFIDLVDYREETIFLCKLYKNKELIIETISKKGDDRINLFAQLQSNNEIDNWKLERKIFKEYLEEKFLVLLSIPDNNRFKNTIEELDNLKESFNKSNQFALNWWGDSQALEFYTILITACERLKQELIKEEREKIKDSKKEDTPRPKNKEGKRPPPPTERKSFEWYLSPTGKEKAEKIKSIEIGHPKDIQFLFIAMEKLGFFTSEISHEQNFLIGNVSEFWEAVENFFEGKNVGSRQNFNTQYPAKKTKYQEQGGLKKSKQTKSIESIIQELNS